MGQTIWRTLESYRGLWVAVDREGKVVDAGENLAELRARTPRARTFVYACGEEVRS